MSAFPNALQIALLYLNYSLRRLQRKHGSPLKSEYTAFLLPDTWRILATGVSEAPVMPLCKAIEVGHDSLPCIWDEQQCDQDENAHAERYQAVLEHVSPIM